MSPNKELTAVQNPDGGLLHHKRGTSTRIHCYCLSAFLLFAPFNFWLTLPNTKDDPIYMKQNATNKSLVILMGNLRGGEEAWETLYLNVLLPNNADLALLVQNDTITPYPNSSLIANAKHVWWYNPYDDWADAIDLINGTGWRESHLPQFVKSARSDFTILFGGIKGYGFDGSGMLIFMLRWFLTQRLLENEILNEYDKFAISRTDHFYLCPHRFSEFDVRNDTIWIPSGENYGGYTDRHLVVGRGNILDSIDILPQLVMSPFHFDGQKHRGTEIFLKYVWDKKKLAVKQFRRSMFTCATESDTGWFLGKGDSEGRRAMMPMDGLPGLFVKYPGEYLEAMQCMTLNTGPSSHWEV